MHKISAVSIMALAMIAGNILPVGHTAFAVSGLDDIVNPSEIGIASYYSYECAKLPMANGKPFDPEKRTCASWFYDFGTLLRVESLETGRVTMVVVTDRGPNKRLVNKGRVIDLSRRAFEDICDTKKGLTRVAISVIS